VTILVSTIILKFNAAIYWFYLAKGNLSSTEVLLEEVPLPVRVRATGPKTYHMGRTLVFVSPDEYKKSRKDSFLLERPPEQNIIMQNNHTTQYHSHTRDIFIR